MENMNELIKLLDAKRKEAELIGEDFKEVDSTYVVKLIDEIFNV